MVKIFFIIIILFILFLNFINDNNITEFSRIDKTNTNKMNELFNDSKGHLNNRLINDIAIHDRLSGDNAIYDRLSGDNARHDRLSDNNDSVSHIWSKKYNNKFYIKIKPLTLEDYTNWKDYVNENNIVDDIYFDPNIEELIIITKNEDIAIVLADLIINNFNGTNTFEESKLLLDTYILKIKNNETFKNKLITNIFNNLKKKININSIKHSDNKCLLNKSNNQCSLNKSNDNSNKENNLSSLNNDNLSSLNNGKIISENNNIQNMDIEAYNDDLDAFDNINYSYLS